MREPIIFAARQDNWTFLPQSVFDLRYAVCDSYSYIGFSNRIVVFIIFEIFLSVAIFYIMTVICTVDECNISHIIIYWRSCVLIYSEIIVIEINIIGRPAQIIIIIRDSVVRSIFDSRLARTNNYDKIRTWHPRCNRNITRISKVTK